MGSDAYLTRRSLLSRLRDWDDKSSWREFFNTYWKLIYSVSLKAGLNEHEAQDVVQETIISVAKQMPTFKYDSNAGSFRNWLLTITHRRITDHLRARKPWDAQNQSKAPKGQSTNTDSTLARLPDENAVDVAVVWNDEWDHNLMDLAIERVKKQVKAKQFQIFDLYVLKEWPAQKICKSMHVNRAVVYMTKHRVSRLVLYEVRRLSEELEQRAKSC